jgi:hypothetical protein
MHAHMCACACVYAHEGALGCMPTCRHAGMHDFTSKRADARTHAPSHPCVCIFACAMRMHLASIHGLRSAHAQCDASKVGPRIFAHTHIRTWIYRCAHDTSYTGVCTGAGASACATLSPPSCNPPFPYTSVLVCIFICWGTGVPELMLCARTFTMSTKGLFLELKSCMPPCLHVGMHLHEPSRVLLCTNT